MYPCVVLMHGVTIWAVEKWKRRLKHFCLGELYLFVPVSFLSDGWLKVSVFLLFSITVNSVAKLILLEVDDHFFLLVIWRYPAMPSLTWFWLSFSLPRSSSLGRLWGLELIQSYPSIITVTLDEFSLQLYCTYARLLNIWNWQYILSYRYNQINFTR